MVPNNRVQRVRFNPLVDRPRSEVMLLSAFRPPSPEEIRFDALLYERRMSLRGTGRGLWSRIWQFVRGE
jgi:hypothetical protein